MNGRHRGKENRTQTVRLFKKNYQILSFLKQNFLNGGIGMMANMVSRMG